MTNLPFKLDIQHKYSGAVVVFAGPAVLAFDVVDGELQVNEVSTNVNPSWKFYDAVIETTRQSYAAHIA